MKFPKWLEKSVYSLTITFPFILVIFTVQIMIFGMLIQQEKIIEAAYMLPFPIAMMTVLLWMPKIMKYLKDPLIQFIKQFWGRMD